MTTPRLMGSRYELGELLGYGGMAEVHRGRDVRLGRDVAIKVLRADLARDQTFLHRFRREAQAAAGLNHPAIVAVYDTGEDIGADSPIPFIVMEYVEGRTLRDVLRTEGRLPARRAMEIVAEVCGALDFSHRNGIVHRDVKPANVMITSAGAVKVMDFGIARALADNSATVTQTAAVIGTAQYLSPEQARGESVDARSDVYSTGCLLYEIVTGHPPFTGDSPVAVAYQHVRENAPAPSSVNPDVPRALDSIVMKALAKNPLNRYQSAAEMRADLQRALANRPVEAEAVLTDLDRTQFISRPAAVAGAVPPVALIHDDQLAGEPPSERRGAWVWVAVVAALLLVIGAAAYAIIALGRDNKPKAFEIPSLINQTPTAATNLLRSQGFTNIVADGTASTCGVNPEIAATPVAEGHICTQDPAPMTKHTKDTRISYKLYKKPTVQVDDYRGKQYADAANAIVGKGLKPARQDVPNSAAAGTVVDQTPAPYTAVAPGATVTLKVSSGKVGVPNVVGLKLAEAAAKLNQQGWGNVTVSPTAVSTADKAKDGTVASQTPVANSTFPQSQPIILTVYKYVPPAPTCTVPPPTTSPPPTTTAPPTTASSTPTTAPLASPGALPPCKT
ncbi:MAG: Stk1 family PASTA domain-containing Ser/Thr kinase [Actinomycetota bacterium]